MHSNITYINDLIKTNGLIDQKLVINKVKIKQITLQKISTLLQSIHKQWKQYQSPEHPVNLKLKQPQIYLLMIHI